MTALLIAGIWLLGCGEPDAKGPPADLTGVWAVTMRYEDGSCPDLTAGSKAAMWTVNRDGDGLYSIAVQGDDAMNAIQGGEDGNTVVLRGLTDNFPAYSTHWRLSEAGGKLKGRAMQTRKAPKAQQVKTIFGDSRSDVVCSVIWSVEATKQGS